MAQLPSPTIAFGIETSCDETAVALVRREADGSATILAEQVLGQVDDHAAFGGVVPEIAARRHLDCIEELIQACLQTGLERANQKRGDEDLGKIHFVSATTGPGLMGGLLVGSVAAQALAATRKVPFIAVNHLEGHALSARLTQKVAFPYVLFLASGGHTQIVLVHDVGSYERIGSTIDDAIGEAFDKTAKLLDLSMPGGPSVEQFARTGDAHRFDLPKPLSKDRTCDFSFAGLKTAVRLVAERHAPLSEQDTADLCASLQRTIADIVEEKLELALKYFASRYALAPVLVAAGGVAANTMIRTRLAELMAHAGGTLALPPLKYCTDNAAMIAWAALEREAAGLPRHPIDVRSRWPLDSAATPMLGSGKRGAKV
ncbi:MAG: tRNA (adenosine(37)-N6)-threonylcarbamoyltransferase complex transferase subunit TsaD [Pseudomonadota bacterium]